VRLLFDYLLIFFCRVIAAAGTAGTAGTAATAAHGECLRREKKKKVK
jgi:hypothetical protein